MKLTVLVDNQTKINRYLSAEPALCYYLELGNKRILFDCGYSDIFLRNAFKLKIDLRDITDIVLSHGHNDHTGGLFYLKQLFQDSRDLSIKTSKPSLIAHPDVFELQEQVGMGNIGCPIAPEQLAQLCEIRLKKEPCYITPDLYFLGEIPQEDVLNRCADDSALVYKSQKGLIIITGCSHSGLKNIIEYAKSVMKTDKINTIIGGFHLIDKTEVEIVDLCQYLRVQKVENIYPSHCCDLRAKVIMAEYLHINEVNVGDIFEWN